MNKQNRKREVRASLLITLLVLGTSGCIQPSSTSFNAIIGQAGQSIPPSAIALRVVDQSNSNSIFEENSALRTFAMTAGKSYVFKIDNSNFPAGCSIEVSSVNTSLPSAVTQTMVLSQGTSILTPAVAGDYSFKVTIKDSNGRKLVSKDYSAGVACANPTFTAESLNANGLSVSGSDNLYNFSAASVVSSANGQGPYLCAYDLTGVGIVDTGFSDCSQTLSNQYVPYISTRRVGVVVKDACNTSYTVTKSAVLNGTVPASPGMAFIQGTISAETGFAATDARIKGVHYLATNVGGHNIVAPSYGGSNYVIQSYMSYGQPSSINFGVQIQVSGLSGSFNLRTNVNGNLDASHAQITKLTYITDEAGDQNPTVSLTTTTCTTTGLHALVKDPIGSPCANSSGGTNNNATVEVWGDYSCTNLSTTGASVTMIGTFDGYTHLVDSCEPGGSAGGVMPVKL